MLHESRDPAREVRVRANISRVINVDLQAQAFMCEVNIEASWLEESLQRVAKKLNKSVTELECNETNTDQSKGVLCIVGDDEKLFTPRLYYHNVVDLLEQESWFEFYATADNRPIVCFRWKLKASFQELFELRLFPFDVQNLTMELGCGWEADHEKNGVLLVKNLNEKYSSLCKTTNFVQCSEYELYPHVKFSPSFTDPNESPTNKRYALLHVTVRVDRKVGYWVLNVVLPLFIITSSN